MSTTITPGPLNQFHGAAAELWNYTTSHSKTTLRLRHPTAGTIDLIMEDTRGIWGPVAWPNSRVSIMKDETSKEHLVRDSPAGFLVTCGSVTVHFVQTEDPT